MTNPTDKRILDLLGGNPDLAEEHYRLLRMKLLRFFEWNHCRSPEDMAQETICRALRRFSEGQMNYGENPHSYFFGIANNLLREEWKRPASDPLQQAEELQEERVDTAPGSPDPVERGVLLNECLRRLDPEESDLILRYYSEGSQQLCEQLRVSSNALRIRVCRIKSKLEHIFRNQRPGPAAE